MKLKPRRFVKTDVAEQGYVHERLVQDVVRTIDELMEQRGISRSALASALEKHPTQISQVLNRPRSMTLRTLSQIFWALDSFPRITRVDISYLDEGLAAPGLHTEVVIPFRRPAARGGPKLPPPPESPERVDIGA